MDVRLADDPFSLVEDGNANLYHDVGAFQDGEMLTCMPIYLSEKQILGLVLARTVGPRGEYSRVGRYSIRFHSTVSDEVFRKDVIEAAKKGKAPTRDPIERDENKWHKTFIAASQSGWMQKRIEEDDYEIGAGVTSDNIPQFRITLV